jgi:hypothetical protein
MSLVRLKHTTLDMFGEIICLDDAVLKDEMTHIPRSLAIDEADSSTSRHRRGYTRIYVESRIVLCFF